MARRSALASQFWNQDIESARSPEACARQAPGLPPPPAPLVPSGLSRAHQILLLQNLLNVPAMPCFDANGGGVVRAPPSGAERWVITWRGRRDERMPRRPGGGR